MSNHNDCDIALIHPPPIFHTERYALFPLPWSLGHVGSSSYIGKYPIGPSWSELPLGFFTMKNFFEKETGYTVNIHNFALSKTSLPQDIYEKYKHLAEKDVSLLTDLAEITYQKQVVSKIKLLKARLFGVDLHWLVHSQGAIKILGLLKQVHPDSYTVVGGMTASYFSDEIMNLFPFIDFLIAGDGCIPLLELFQRIEGNRDFSRVPNLLYRDNGQVKRGPERVLNDFSRVQKHDSMVETIPTARGCPLQCINCGGSKYSSGKILNYPEPLINSIESIMGKLFKFAEYSKETPKIFLIHDPFLTLGRRNWEILLDEIKRNGLNLTFVIEFFSPHSREDILNIAEKVPGSEIHISPETMDERVRRFQRNLEYPNSDLVMNMDVINDIDSLSMHVWFMTGLAKETRRSVDDNLSFVREYYRKIKDKTSNRIRYNELLFVDPGSLAFDSPDKYGYELLDRSFLWHMESFEMPIFKYQINYRTTSHSRDQLFDLFLYMHDEMNEIYYENNVITRELYDRATLYIELLRRYSQEYDEAMLEKDKRVRNKRFEEIGNRLRGEL